MEAYQQRVVEEANELDERRAKLHAFIYSSLVYDDLPADEKTRMRLQLGAIDLYSLILWDRINHFPKVAVA